MAANIKLIFDYFLLNLKKEWQYKTSFFMQIVMMILNDAFFIIQWVVIFQIVDDIGGYGLNEALMLFALSAGYFGIAKTFFGGIFNINSLIYDGKLDVYLTQPKNLLINVSCSSTDISAIGDIFYVFVVLVIVGAAWWWYFAILPIIILGGILYASLYATYASLAFFVKRGDAVAQAVEGAFMKADKYPPSIYNFAVKVLLYTVIPSAFFTFVPLEYLLLGFNIWWACIYVGFISVWVFLAFFCFRRGVKRYNSGSLFGGRL